MFLYRYHNMLYCVFFLLSKYEKSFYMTIEIFYAIISQKHIFHNLISFSMGSWQSALPVGFNRWNLKEERLSLPVGYQRKSCFYSKIKMNKAGGLIFRENMNGWRELGHALWVNQFQRTKTVDAADEKRKGQWRHQALKILQAGWMSLL